MTAGEVEVVDKFVKAARHATAMREAARQANIDAEAAETQFDTRRKEADAVVPKGPCAVVCCGAAVVRLGNGNLMIVPVEGAMA